MTSMRAKVRVSSVFPLQNGEGKQTSERLQFSGVAKSSPYPEDGADEDNTFARWSPSVSMDFHVANPALFGAFAVGDTFYVDFTPVERPSPAK